MSTHDSLIGFTATQQVIEQTEKLTKKYFGPDSLLGEQSNLQALKIHYIQVFLYADDQANPFSTRLNNFYGSFISFTIRATIRVIRFLGTYLSMVLKCIADGVNNDDVFGAALLHCAFDPS